MKYGVKEYSHDLVTSLGNGWNRFWFTPSDPTAIGALRASVGALSLIWFWGIAQELTYFFGSNGLLPSGSTLDPKGWKFSILDLLGDGGTLAGFKWGGMLLLAAFTLGLFSRVTSVLSLVLVLSVLHRKAMLLGPFEIVLAPILLYLCIGPSGAAVSLDAFLRRRKQADFAPPKTYANTIATRLLQIHLVAIYAMMVLAKLRVGMWWGGTAVWWMTSKSDTRLVDFTGLDVYILNAWTHAIVLFEGAFAALIWNPLARPILLALSVVMWGSLCLVTGDVLFSLLMIVAGFAFVSPDWLRANCLQCESTIAKRT